VGRHIEKLRDKHDLGFHGRFFGGIRHT
jgi:hypothetical protein